MADEHGGIDKPEPRWQALAAVLAVAGIYLALPRHLIVGPIWLLPTIIVVLLVPIIGFIFLPKPRRIERHVGGKRGLTHAGTARDDDEIGRMQAAEQRIQIGEARRHAGDVAAVGKRVFGQLDGLRQRDVEIERAFAVPIALGDPIEGLLRFLELLGGREFLFGLGLERRAAGDFSARLAASKGRYLPAARDATRATLPPADRGG